jgi:hypothetical protein
VEDLKRGRPPYPLKQWRSPLLTSKISNDACREKFWLMFMHFGKSCVYKHRLCEKILLAAAPQN